MPVLSHEDGSQNEVEGPVLSHDGDSQNKVGRPRSRNHAQLAEIAEIVFNQACSELVEGKTFKTKTIKNFPAFSTRRPNQTRFSFQNQTRLTRTTIKRPDRSERTTARAVIGYPAGCGKRCLNVKASCAGPWARR